jgi:hypothetical protein
VRRARGKQGLRRRCGDGGQETGDEVRARVSRAHPPLLAPALCTPRRQRLCIQMRPNNHSSSPDKGAAHGESGAPQQHRMQACRLMPCATSIEPTSVPNHTPATAAAKTAPFRERTSSALRAPAGGGGKARGGRSGGSSDLHSCSSTVGAGVDARGDRWRWPMRHRQAMPQQARVKGTIKLAKLKQNITSTPVTTSLHLRTVVDTGPSAAP